MIKKKIKFLYRHRKGIYIVKPKNGLKNKK